MPKKKSDVMFVKAIAIIFVVLGHSIATVAGQSTHYSSMLQSSLLKHIYTTIYVFHMPLFFSTSGYVLALSFDKASFSFGWNWICKKIKRLIVPLLAAAILYTFPLRMLTGYYDTTDIISNIINLVITNDVGHLWYLETLFILTMFFALFRNVMQKNTVLTTLILFGGYIGAYNKIFLLRFGIWLWIGMLIYRNVSVLIQHKEIIAGSSIILVSAGMLSRTFSHNSIVNDTAGILMTLGIIFGLFSLAWQKEKSGELKIVSFMNKNAMPIYLFHEPAMFLVFYGTRDLAVNPYIIFVGAFSLGSGMAYAIGFILRALKMEFLLGE